MKYDLPVKLMEEISSDLNFTEDQREVLFNLPYFCDYGMESFTTLYGIDLQIDAFYYNHGIIYWYSISPNNHLIVKKALINKANLKESRMIGRIKLG